jgi:hypothetical protein
MDAAVIMAGVAMPDADMLAMVMVDKATHEVARAASAAVRLAADFTEVAVVDSAVAEAAASTAVAVVASTAAEADTGNL